MNPRKFLVITATLALGCGGTQHTLAPEETRVDGFPAPHPAQQRPGKNGKCKAPGWPATIIVKAGGCWVELDATAEQCMQHQRENPYHVPYEGRCWYPLPGNNGKGEPTSSL